jgi:transposase
MTNFRPTDRLTGFLMPPSVDEWLPQKHLARFVVEVVDGLDLAAMSKSYRGSGSASYHPKVVLSILIYGYATGVFSSRKLERATYDSLAVELIVAATTKTGLKVRCELDTRLYPKGIKVSSDEMATLNIKGDAFHPEWNYSIGPECHPEAVIVGRRLSPKK